MNRLFQLFKLVLCVPLFVDKVEYRRSHDTYVQLFFQLSHLAFDV